MDFDVGVGDATDEELWALLVDAYVDDGFTSLELAQSAFEPSAVRARGELLCARDGSGSLAGMVILVPSGSAAARLAKDGEVEMQLLAVSSRSRSRGLGRALVAACVERATTRSATRMVLWTQPAMKAAQRLYESAGFKRNPGSDFERAGRTFLVYEMSLRAR